MSKRESKSTIHTIAASLDPIFKMINSSNINSRDDEGATPLHYAARAGSRSNVAALLEAEKRHRDKTPSGEIPILERNAVDNNGQTALHYAASAGAGRAAEILVRYGANINAPDNEGKTQLHHYAIGFMENINKDFRECVPLARIECQSQNIHNGKGFDMVLRDMVRDRMSSNFKLLGGVNHEHLNARDHKGKTPFHYFAETKFLDEDTLARTMDSYKADFKRDYWGVIPRPSLPRIKESLNIMLDQAIESLVRAGADINAPDNEGKTPLHSALDSGAFGAIESLVRAGADINALDREGRTALQNCDLMVDQRQKEDAKNLLLRCGAAVEAMGDKANDAEAIFRDSIKRLESGREFRDEQTQLKGSLIQILNALESSNKAKIDMAKHIGSYLRDILPSAKIKKNTKEKMSDFWQKLAHKFGKVTSRDKSHGMIKSLLQAREIELGPKFTAVPRSAGNKKPGQART